MNATPNDVRRARCRARRPRGARADAARPRRGDRRQQRRRHRRLDDVRRAQRHREPARQRAARGGRPQRRATRVVRPELARGARDDPRGPQARARRGAAVVPVQRGGDGVRHRQLRRDDGRRRRRAGAAGRARSAPTSRRCARSSSSAAPVPEGCTGWDEVLAAAPDTEPPTPADASEAGAAMIYTSGTTGKPKGALRTSTDRTLVFALLAELNLLHENSVHLTTGPLYHSGPLAFASLSHTLGAPIVVLRKFDAGAVDRTGEDAPRHQHVLRADAAEADRVAPDRDAGDGRPVVDGDADRQRGAGAVLAEGGDRRQARRRLPLRGVRLDRARRRHRAAAARTNCASPARAASPTAASRSGS